MIKGKRVLAIIPARGGSKGIHNKNIRLIDGKPLIYYSINAAKKCKFIDKIIVSTDSNLIAKISKKYGDFVPFMRPKRLAGDKSKTIDCIVYTIGRLKKIGINYDILIILQPTSPLRTYIDIVKALQLFIKENKSVVSVNKIDINPLLLRSISNNRLKTLIKKSSTLRRQDLPQFYIVNGAIYINNIRSLTKCTSLNDNKIAYIMKKRNSIDIDSLQDLYMARKFYGSN